jgi:hypothetical protein
LGKEILAAPYNLAAPGARPVLAHLFFPCSVQKTPDNSLFRALEIPCSAPGPACKRWVAKPATP